MRKKEKGKGSKMEEVSGEELAVLFDSSLGILILCPGQIQTQGFRNCARVCASLSLREKKRETFTGWLLIPQNDLMTTHTDVTSDTR